MGRATALSLMASVLVGCIVISSGLQTKVPFNITTILRDYPNYSLLNELLSSSGVAEDINSRTSLTLLAPSNDALNAFQASHQNEDSAKIADLLRYHVLLQYFGIPELEALNMANYSAVTTLLQTTGKVEGDEGFVNIYNTPTAVLIGHANLDSSPNSTVVSNVTQSPYDISIIQIDRVLIPIGFESASGGANITEVLESFHEFSHFIGLLKQTAVDAVFAGKQTGAGITVFAPKDSAFNGLPSSSFQSLTIDQQKLLMQYHALDSYYSMEKLKALSDSSVPTISSSLRPGYVLNVTAVAPTVTLQSGITVATITSTLYDTRPVTVYAIDAVLLPEELFAKPAAAPSPAGGPSSPTGTGTPPPSNAPGRPQNKPPQDSDAPDEIMPAGTAYVADAGRALRLAALLGFSIFAVM